MSVSIKKTGVPFTIVINTKGNVSGLSNTITAVYEDVAGNQTDIVGGTGTATVTELTPGNGIKAGTYQITTSVPQKGDYKFYAKSTDAAISDMILPVLVQDANIDDVKGVVDASALTIDAIKTKVDVLDADELNNLKEQIEALSANVTAIGDVVDSSGDGAVDSVMEFVTNIQNALADGGTGLAALKGYTDDVENMLSGAATFADGSASPFEGKGLVAIFDKIVENNGDIASVATAVANVNTAIGNVQNVLGTAISDSQAAIEAKIAEVKTVVDANQALLESETFGLSAIKTVVDGIVTDIAGINNNDVLAVLNDATNGLGAIKTSIETKIEAVRVLAEDNNDMLVELIGRSGGTASNMVI